MTVTGAPASTNASLPNARTLIPGAWRVLALGLLASPAIALLHASQDVLLSRLERSGITLSFVWPRLLLVWVTLAVCAATVAPFVRRFPLPQPRPTRAIVAHVVATVVFPIVHLGLLDAVHVIATPEQFIEHFKWLIAAHYVSELAVFPAIAGVLHAIRHVRMQSALREDALRLKAALADARFSALTHQLRPHFLFNALNSAAMLVRAGESTEAVDLLARLSGLMREVLRDHPHEVVPLSEEFAFLREYLLLEEARFGNRLGVTLDCDQRLRDTPVPFLILQPIVENALRYGVAARSGPAQLRVGATSTADGILLCVEERGNGGRAGPAEAGHGVGIANTCERLRARYGDQASFSLDVDSDGRGSLAEIRLPISR
jgi:hypothetical protein